MIIELLHREIENNKGSSYIIDGFPRTLSQAVMFESIIGESQMLLHLTTPMEEVMKRLIMKYEGTKEEGIKKRLEEYMTKAQPAVDYYTRFGKVRKVDCSGSISETYKAITQAILPQIYCVIGPKSCGKSSICHHLAARAGMKYINFASFTRMHKSQGKPSETLMQELIKYFHAENIGKVVLDGFPENMSQLQYMLGNGVQLAKFLYINANESCCLKINQELGVTHKEYLSPPILCKAIKEFYATTKELLAFCKKKNLVTELRNTEEKPLSELLKTVNKLLDPEILLVKCQESAALEMASMTKVLAARGYQIVELASLEYDEILRKTKIGLEMAKYREKGEKMPLDCCIRLARKFVYPVSGNGKILLAGFPKNIKELELFEEACGTISREFYFYTSEDPNSTEFTLQTYMHSQNRLTPLQNFSYDLMDTYNGTQLQYVLISGPGQSGKTSVAKRIEKCGFILLDMDSLTEELKKKMSTEENPPESINVTFDQKLEELKNRTLGRKNKEDRFVLDGLVFEDTDSIRKVVTALGPPMRFIELMCDPKELTKRYMKKGELAEMNEEEKGKFEKKMEAYNGTKKELAVVAGNKSVRYHEIKTDGPEDKLGPEVKEIFEPRLILLKHDSDINVGVVLMNLGIRYGFLFLDLANLIKQEIEDQTPIGKQLAQTKKPRELSKEYAGTDDSKYCAIHYELKTVVNLIKQTIKKKGSKSQYIVINGFLNAHKLESWEEKQEFRAMDELFAIEKEIGQVRTVINFTKNAYEEFEDDRVPEKPEPKVKPAAKSEKPKEDAEGSPEKTGEEKGRVCNLS